MNTELLEELTTIELILTGLVEAGEDVASELGVSQGELVCPYADISVKEMTVLRDRIRGRINIMVHAGKDDYDYHRPAE